MRDKLCWVFRGWEVAQTRHRFVNRSWNLICGLLRPLMSVRPIIFTRQHVYRAALGVDGGYTRTAVKAAKVEVEVTVKDLYRN